MQTSSLRGIVLTLLAAAGSAQVTTRVSVSSSGVEGLAGAQHPSVSGDGRFVAFESGSLQLVPGDTNGVLDVFVRDTLAGTTERVSVSSSGAQGAGLSRLPSISSDGRFVVFQSSAPDLVSGDTNGVLDVFVRERLTGMTERISVSTSGAQGDGSSYTAFQQAMHGALVSDDGRYVAFESSATNLVPGDTNATVDSFVRDRWSGSTQRVSVATDGTEGNSASYGTAISADGRWVAFSSQATSLVAGDASFGRDVYIRDLLTGTTGLISVSTGGTAANADCRCSGLSADGRFVVFTCLAGNLVPGDTNLLDDVFVRDRALGLTERVSVTAGGSQAAGVSTWGATSADGSLVAFASTASNLVAGDTNMQWDVFVRDRGLGTTTRASVSTDGAQAVGPSWQVALDRAGRFLAFTSSASNLVSGDTNNAEDTFVHDRDATGDQTSAACDLDGGAACPCQNPPSGPGRGCDNSAATGGARLSATGLSYLSADSLAFTAADELPTATSIFLQGDAEAPSAAVFGQGLRCAGGSLLRLYVKTASGGIALAPASGEPSVSARSALLGEPIGPGASRWYLVYYRDPVVLGGCPPSSTFNATGTLRVVWWV